MIKIIKEKNIHIRMKLQNLLIKQMDGLNAILLVLMFLIDY